MRLDKRKTALFAFVFLLLVLSVIFTTIGISRTYKGSNDFDTFYTAGESILNGTGVYYSDDYYQMTHKIAPFLYPPFAACFFALFAFFPLPFAVGLWTVLLISLLVASFVFMFKFLDLKDSEIPKFIGQIPLTNRFLLASVAIATMIDNMTMLQINILVFFLCLVSLVYWQKKKNIAAGIVLSAAIFLKLTPVLFCLYFACKKSWRVLTGVLIGSILWAALVPSLFLGWEQNRIYQRQWFGRMIKPAVISLVEKIKPSTPNSQNRSVKELQDTAVSQQLSDTNQSLSAVLTRLFLKDRGRHQVAYRFRGLPIIAGGISEKHLNFLIMLLRIVFLGGCVYLWAGQSKVAIPLEASLVFVTSTLLSPITRSHYYVTWIFAYLVLFFVFYKQRGFFRHKFFFWTTNISVILYFLLAVPYGEAAGMGAWANLVLWVGCAACIRQLKMILQKV